MLKVRWVLTALIIPWAYLLVAALAFPPLWMQVELTLVSTPARFADVVHLSGGSGAVLLALALDFVFIVSFGVLATLMLRRADGLWWLPLIAGGLDTLENVTVILFLGSPPGVSEVRGLQLLAILKLFAYGASVIALWAAFRVRR